MNADSPANEERLLTVEEAGRLLNVHRNSVYNLTNRGELKYVQFSGMRGRRVALSEIHAYIRRNTTGGWKAE